MSHSPLSVFEILGGFMKWDRRSKTAINMRERDDLLSYMHTIRYFSISTNLTSSTLCENVKKKL